MAAWLTRETLGSNPKTWKNNEERFCFGFWHSSHLVGKVSLLWAQESVERKGSEQRTMIGGNVFASWPACKPILEVIRDHQMLSPSLLSVL